MSVKPSLKDMYIWTAGGLPRFVSIGSQLSGLNKLFATNIRNYVEILNINAILNNINEDLYSTLSKICSKCFT